MGGFCNWIESGLERELLATTLSGRLVVGWSFDARLYVCMFRDTGPAMVSFLALPWCNVQKFNCATILPWSGHVMP